MKNKIFAIVRILLLIVVLVLAVGLVVDRIINSEKLTEAVVFIGDSMTANYVGIEELFPDAVNEGVPGQNSKQIQSRFGEQVLQRHPKVVHILAGTNDDIRSKSDKVVSRIIDMALAARIQGASVVIGTIPPYNETIFWQASYALQFNNKLKQEAQVNKIPVADYYSAMIDLNGRQNQQLFMADGIHQNAAGAAVMRDVLTKVDFNANGHSFIDYIRDRYYLLRHRIKN